jgi:FlaA1/EpsC-like NDP-sugar epimerase
VDILLRKNPFAVAGLQSLLVIASFTTAWLLRFEFSLPHSEVLLGAAPFLVLFRLLAMWRYNLFHGYWRYTGVSDAADIGKAIVLGSAGFFVTMRFVLGVVSLPLSVYFLEALLTAVALGGLRLLSRMMLQRFDLRHQSDRVRVLIVGAGAAASALIRELLHTQYEAVGCVDDDKMKKGARLQGLPVLGTIEELPHVSVAYQVKEIFIAMPSVTGLPMRRVIEQCLATGMKFKTIPGLGSLLEGHVRVEQLRDVNLEELLGREPVRLDLKAMRRDLTDQVVLVTGAAGSIGQELCSQILACSPAKLICLDQAETPMFFLQLKLNQSNYGGRVVYCVADITDAESMKSILLDQSVQIIFNAAAYKHVPMMERNVAEAVRNNVFGLIKLLEAAEEAGCERFLLISSDKAVNPTSVMGATKRMGELILASRPSKMRCASVRFGNVLGSQGSVVPVFQEQIRKEGRVTVTHPEITRYFMTIPEAVSLVIQAFTIGDHGDVLVLDMGEPVRITDLARTLVRMSGASESEVPIVFTGLRPGEKLYEELFYSTEILLPTPHEKVQRTRGSSASWTNLSQQLGELRRLTRSGSDASMRAKIQDIVPEYVHETISVPCEDSTKDIAEPRVATIRLARAAAAND